jgi:hypothetical protein
VDTITHVVVLMFENRSFDHMLGLLSDDPAFPGVRPGDDACSNPVDPTNPTGERVCVTDDSAFGLAVDPPHGHASVVEQLGRRGTGAPAMDGFISSYSRKLAGREAGLPVVHWRRIAGLAAAIVAVAAAVLALPWVAPLVAGTVALLAVVEGAIGWAHRRRRTLPVERWLPVFVAPVAAVAVGGVLSAVLGIVAGYAVRFVGLAVLMAVPLALLLRKKRSEMRRPPHEGGAHHIMRCMRPMDRLPALATLASNFALCTRWHCSVPGATWPNRNFAHAGSSDGTVDIEIGFYTNPTIFSRLSDAGRSWAIYRDRKSLAQAMAFEWLIDDERLVHWRHLDEFVADVEHNQLAAYTFIEPSHDGRHSSSQHPGNNEDARRPPAGGLWDFERGENLIVDVYEALRANPQLFDRTLLVITYDEHGGFYDHVPPPTDAVEPEPFGAPRQSWTPRLVGWFVEQPESRFRFNVLGPRVPTVVVGPRVPAQWVDTCFDHTAIPATVRRRFAPDSPPLSAREAASPTFDCLASLASPRTDLPDLGRFRKPEVQPRGPVVLPPPATDEFAIQLRELGRGLRGRFGVTARGDETSTEDVAELFTARADAARRRSGG